MPVLQCNQKNPESKDNNKEIKIDNNEEENKTFQTVFVPTPIFFNHMLKTSKGFYGKYPKRKPDLLQKGQVIGYVKTAKI